MHALASSLAKLAARPRVRLAHLPTPLEPLDRLRAHLGAAPRLWVKRDDCTGLGLGGNKVRKLEFLLAEALAQGADAVVTGGVVQSNHIRQTAAAAAKLGLECHLAVMTGRVPHRNGALSQCPTRARNRASRHGVVDRRHRASRVHATQGAWAVRGHDRRTDRAKANRQR